MILLFPLTADAKTIRKQATVAVGQQIKLEYKGLNSVKVKWKVNNPKLLRISKGKIMGLKPGVTKISGKYKKNTYVFSVKVISERQIKAYIGKSSGVKMTIWSISKNKVVWKLNNTLSEKIDIHPVCFQLGNKTYYIETNKCHLTMPNTTRTSTFKRGVNFYDSVDMNAHYAAFYFYKY